MPSEDTSSVVSIVFMPVLSLFPLSDLPFYPTGKIRPGCAIDYQMFVRCTAWQHFLGSGISGFINDL
jgi:hypothetical protein